MLEHSKHKKHILPIHDTTAIAYLPFFFKIMYPLIFGLQFNTSKDFAYCSGVIGLKFPSDVLSSNRSCPFG